VVLEVQEINKMEMNKNKALIDELLKMPPMVLSTAYLYALNLTNYGVDVMEKWSTAAVNAYALQKAYQKGYQDASQKISNNWERRSL
jgi:hypothetical protein